MTKQKTPCRFFQRGHCRKGDACDFSHSLDGPSTAHKTTTLGRHITSDDAPSNPHNRLERWRFNIPTEQQLKSFTPLGNRLSHFFKEALELVEVNAENMQQVISLLATEGGHRRLNELFKQEFELMSDNDLQQLFDAKMLPLLNVLSHESVLSSLIIETQLATLLNFLYGPNGTRAVKTFKTVVRYLKAADEKNMMALEPCVIVLSLVLQTNAQAMVKDELETVTKALVGFGDGRTLSGPLRRHLNQLRLRVGLQELVPNANLTVHKRAKPGLKATFKVEQDLPGKLSKTGPRHDNDREDIKDIRIFPTMDEIHSTRGEYLPRQNPEEWHLSGLAGLLDRHFRLLREDTVGQLRDAAKFELERLQNPTVQRQKNIQGARTYSYQNIEVVDLGFDEQRGLLLVLKFDQPVQVRGRSEAQRREWWNDSLRLSPDVLVSLLGSDGSVVFLTVAELSSSQPTTANDHAGPPALATLHGRFSRFEDPHSAYVVVQFANEQWEDVEKTLTWLRPSQGDALKRTLTLLEFPGIVVASFESTLNALQEISKRLDVPFADILAPTRHTGDVAEIAAPAYAQAPGFKFDLRPILSDAGPTTLDPRTPLDATTLAARSQLDFSQAQALIACLTRSLALVQGPPGTGKSYTGVAVLKVLLENRERARLGPILCVTFTNHALDQLLEHLVDAGITQIVRIGSRSKSEKLASVNLRHLAQQYTKTYTERHARRVAKEGITATKQKIDTILDRIRTASSQQSIKNYLLSHNKSQYESLFGNTKKDDAGFIEVSHKRAKGLPRWLRGRARQQHERLRSRESLLSAQDLWSLSYNDRLALYGEWINAILEPLKVDLEITLDDYRKHKSDCEKLRGEIDLRVLSEAHVIGVTTTGLARNLKYLRKLRSRVLLVEEAGEVLEAHLLTALLPSIEHMILIGDHQQLRPKAQNYELSCENPHSQIALDISLFERLVRPVCNAPRNPYETLTLQRRMFPSISNLIRSTLYPNLQDAPSVSLYPQVTGMRHRLFWFDHKEKEDGKNEHVHSTSHSNSFEVKMVASLVHHLVGQGTYDSNDIAVLTPYLGQLRKLRRALNAFTEIVLNDRDIDDLVQDVNEEVGCDDVRPLPLQTISKGNLLQAIRLATVDNFQGEEAKVVVISLVRSNDEGNCGFLRTSNRINVLLSRAQHGMYIIGNSETARPVPVWNDVLRLLQEKNSFGEYFELCCPRHPETPLLVKEPDDFVRVAPEGGCELMCGKRLPCGHSCVNKCHSKSLHRAVYCLKPCTRPKPGCSHNCPYECGRPCDPKCRETVTDVHVRLVCGHVINSLPCWQYQDRSSIRCKVLVEKRVPECEHKVKVRCNVDVSRASYQCTATCGVSLDCGHACQKQCKTCRPRNYGKIERGDHGKCQKTCGRPYRNCKHTCKAQCHGTDNCPPCNERCEVFCSHGGCNKSCYEPCTPCAEEICSSRCPHSACDMPCAAPCSWIPCSRRCEKQLSCGHRCPSICGEACPSVEFCQGCASEELKARQVDVLLFTTYGEVDIDESPCIFPKCGHFYTVQSLDGFMSMGDHYDLDENGMPRAIKGS